MDAASREGAPLNIIIEKSLRNILKAHKLGISLEELTRLIEITYTQKASGMIFIPLEILHYLESKADNEELESKWYEAGAWYGKYIKERFKSPAEVIAGLLKAARPNLDEIDVKEEGETINYRCVSAALSMDETIHLQKFIEGAMHSLGYKTVKRDILKGIILLEFKRQS